MYLTTQQIDLYWNSFDKIKNYKVTKSGIVRKGLSAYAKREIRDLFELNQRLGTCNVKGNQYFKKEALIELKRIAEIIPRHKKLFPIYKDLCLEVTKTKDLFIKPEIMDEIIRFEVALNIEVNIDYIDSIDAAFNDVYMELINGKYLDRYHEDNIKGR